jgi:hypothetical protein
MTTRKFWTLSKGKSIGFIESTFQSGLIFSTDFINFRETSSNLSSGNSVQISTSKLTPEERLKIEAFMIKKLPVSVEYSRHFLGSPLNGLTLEPLYLHSSKSLIEETINITVAKGSKSLE